MKFERYHVTCLFSLADSSLCAELGSHSLALTCSMKRVAWWQVITGVTEHVRKCAVHWVGM